MAVKITLPSIYSSLIGDKKTVEVEGKNTGECLDALVGFNPRLKEELFDKRGELKTWIELYVNNRSIYPKELDYPVKDGDEIHIIIFLSGG